MIKIITGQFCSRCHMIAPKLKEYSEKKWYEYIEKDISAATPEELGEATQLPVIWFDDRQVEFDEALSLITNTNG